MAILNSDLEMYTSRFSVQGGPTRDGVKCKLHPISAEICLHLHDFYEIELVVSGEMSQTVNGVPLISGEGGFVFMDLLSVQRIARPEKVPSVWTISNSRSTNVRATFPPILRGSWKNRFPVSRRATFRCCSTA